MKERRRWRCEEDALLRAYVKQYGPREWHLVSHRMNNTSFHRDAKSCLERWKNYLKPGIKKGSLTDDEQRLLLRLQANHGNKWKKIASHLPGRTPKRLGKWWEVFKHKQHRHHSLSIISPSIHPTNYDRILESFADKLVPKMNTPPPPPPPPPHWLHTITAGAPSVALTLSPYWVPVNGGPEELGECFGKLQEGFQAWGEQRKEAAWRLNRLELQLETEKATRRREKVEEVEAKIRALREEAALASDRIEADCREQVAALRRDAEEKEQKLAEHWAEKHARMRRMLVDQLQWIPAAAAAEAAAAAAAEMNGR